MQNIYSTLKYCNEDIRLPIYTKGERKDYTVEELVELIFNPISGRV